VVVEVVVVCRRWQRRRRRRRRGGNCCTEPQPRILLLQKEVFGPASATGRQAGRTVRSALAWLHSTVAEGVVGPGVEGLGGAEWSAW
jgi:hypothetical protein